MGKVAAVSALPASKVIWVLAVSPCISRAAMLLVISRFSYVRPEGMGSVLTDQADLKSLLAGMFVALITSVVTLGAGGVLLLAAGCGTAMAVGVWSERQIRGLTGDVYGAASEVSETATLVLAAGLTSLAPEVELEPIFMSL